MNVDKLKEGAEKHLYAGELLHKFAAQDMAVLMEHMSDDELAGAVKIRAALIEYATSELLVASSLCDIAENREASC